MRSAIIILVILLNAGLFAQKSLEASRTSNCPRIDGVLDESCWQQASPAKEFIQKDLHPGLPSELETEVKVLYDDDALYISAQLYDTSPDSILKELSTRDNEANAELFGVFFDTYNDDINAYGFFVTSAGTQIDARYSNDVQDFEWNAVWMSEVKLNDKGWAVEMKIPYSALRFAAKEVQSWGFNIIRKIRRKRESSFWNKIDPRIGALVRQFGELTGLKNIKPPVRLSLTPYVAGIATHYPHNDPAIKDLNYTFSGGADIKYGLSDAFTLDMTMVPDFSQVQSDNQVLNLSQFEVQFQERRPFFTEGTELFNKGGLFYSRRVGGLPIYYSNAYTELKQGEEIVKNPSQTLLLNATKVSGRTASKTGIGVFNGLSNTTYAILQDSIGNQRSVLTSPLTNYNILVADQALKNNSYVSLINTNVTREGHHQDANVSGVLFRFNDKKNMHVIGGKAIMSNKFFSDSTKPVTGYQSHVEFGKNGGNFRWSLYGTVNSDLYDPNDLGIMTMRNNTEAGAIFNYNIYRPFWKLNNLFNRIHVVYQRMYNPNAFWNFGIYGNNNTTFTKRFLTVGCNYGIEPIITYDYYEARIPGRFYTFPINYRGGGFISTDYRRSFALDISGEYRKFLENNRYGYNLEVSPRLRVNNALSFIIESSVDLQNDNIGFVTYNPYSDSITFGRRNLQTVSNVISSVYKFSNKASLTFRLRHYWSMADYKQYYHLERDGSLSAYEFGNNGNVNFNAFNIDMVFFWQFAPGSELNLVWKNSLLKRENEIYHDYYANFKGSLSSPQNNMLSLKILYYLDYQNVKRAFKREGI